MVILFNKVTIIGVGLIGGSLAKVLKSRGLSKEITGAGRGRETLELALSAGVIDRVSEGLSQSVKDADLVVLASPVGAFEHIVAEIGPRMKMGAILTDVGSVKGALVKRIEAMLPAGVHYVPGHPIAGKEKHGVAEATETLFRGAKCILTPTVKTDPQALEVMRALWSAAGANVVLMDADAHDHIFAAVSHLPHTAAFAMVNTVAEFNAGPENYMSFSGAGFRDFTRIAASSPEMWRDVCLLNGENIIEMIEQYQSALNSIKKAIERRDADKLDALFQTASGLRRGLG
ncbi:MAG: prephenate dehydrogenase/arogenate dehydrogenase family protein [Nitrospirota bacterium]